MLYTQTSPRSFGGDAIQLQRAVSKFTLITSRSPSMSVLGSSRVSIGDMAAVCSLNYASPLPRGFLFTLPSKYRMIDNVTLHSVVKTTNFPLQNTDFPVLPAVRVNTEHRFRVMCMSHYSYDVHQDRAAYFTGLSATGVGKSKPDKGDVLGPILNFEKVMLRAEKRGICLPLDMFEAAKNTGIPELCLERYLSLQGCGWGIGFAVRSCSIFRNQMMINPYHPGLLGLMFVSNLFDDVTTANAMIHGGKTSVDVFAYFFSNLFARLVLYGLISPFSYNERLVLRLRESISRGLMRLFQHPNGSLPPCNRMFEVKAEKSEIFTRVAYCFAAVISAGLLFQYYLYRIYQIRGPV